MHDIQYLDHVAFGVSEFTKAGKILHRLGGRPKMGGPAIEFEGGQFAFPSSGGATLEIIQPSNELSFLQRFLDSNGPSIHHVTFYTKDFDRSLKRAEELGFQTILGSRDQHWKEFFLHPKSALGIVVQFVQKGERGHEEEDPTLWTRQYDGFSELEKEPDAEQIPAFLKNLQVVGLRLSCTSLESARKLWVTMVQGHEEGYFIDSKSRLPVHVFTWSNSPIRIAVLIDPNEKKLGAKGIEIKRAEDGREEEKGNGEWFSSTLGARFLFLRPTDFELSSNPSLSPVSSSASSTTSSIRRPQSKL